MELYATVTDLEEVSLYTYIKETLEDRGEGEAKFNSSHIKDKFYQKDCQHFVPVRNQDVQANTDLRCYCGDVLRNHVASVHEEYDNVEVYENGPLQSTQLWCEATSIVKSKTSDYGQIIFEVDSVIRLNPSLYVRLSDDESRENIQLLLKVFQGMMYTKPSLCLFILGGDTYNHLGVDQKRNFIHDLIKTVKISKSWIVTNGLNYGVSKLIADELKDWQIFHSNESRSEDFCQCIGITSWGKVKDREILQNIKDESHVKAKYRPSVVKGRNGDYSLNPNHTHFVFVDDGYRNEKGHHLDLQRKIQQQLYSSDDFNMPVVLVVLQGHYDVIDHVIKSLQDGCLVVVCSGTGGAADVLSYVAVHSFTSDGEWVSDKKKQKTKNIILHTFGKLWSYDDRDKRADTLMNQLQSCFKKNPMIFICNLIEEEDLSQKILRAILQDCETVNTSSVLMNQMEMAVRWNRADILEELLCKTEHVNTKILKELLMNCIEECKVDVLKVLLNHGLSIKEILTIQHLQELYDKIPSTGSFYSKLFSGVSGGNQKLKCACQFVKSCLDIFTDHKFTRKDSFYTEPNTLLWDKPHSMCPYKHLLIWSVLCNRLDMSLFFWELSTDPIISALSVTRICIGILQVVPKYENKIREDFENMIQIFRGLAIEVLDECHSSNANKSILVTEKTSHHWGNMSCLQIAAASKDQTFLASAGTQYYVDSTWNQRILSSAYRVVTSIFLPFLIFTGFMKFAQTKNNPITWLQRIKAFYTAPCTKFSLHWISHLTFLFLFSYMILMDFRADPSLTEWICIGWIFTFLINDIHTFLGLPSPTTKGKVSDWCGLFISMDVLNLSLALIGFVIRWFSPYVFYAKDIYSINVIMFYIKVLRLYNFDHALGPKIYMVMKMLKELMMFCLILVVIILAYGVASQSLLYKSRRNFGVSIVRDIVYYPYWQLYGEIFLEEIQTDEACVASENITTLSTFANTCRTENNLVYFLLAGYLLLGNILMLNLLIAIFSRVFDKFESRSLVVWKNLMYFLLCEYQGRSFIAPPFSIIVDIYCATRWLLCRPCRTKTKDPEEFLSFIEIFEKQSMQKVLRRKEAMKTEAQSQNRFGPPLVSSNIGVSADGLFTDIEEVKEEGHDIVKVKPKKKKKKKHVDDEDEWKSHMEIQLDTIQQTLQLLTKREEESRL